VESVETITEGVHEETEDLSRSDLQATIEMTREELALRWEGLNRDGEKIEHQFEESREWIAERLQAAYREEDERDPQSFEEFADSSGRIAMPIQRPPWTAVMRSGLFSWGTPLFRNLLQVPDSKRFLMELRTCNTLLLRYGALRHERLDVAWGTSGPDLEEYTPSKKPKRLLQAVAKLDEEKEGLAEADSKAAIYRLVHARLNGGETEDGAAKRLNEALRGDMKRGGFTSRFPETPEKLVELAQTLSQRWDNVVPLSEPER
jgi:hypothetical protein